MNAEELAKRWEDASLAVENLRKERDGLRENFQECKRRSHEWKLHTLRSRVQVERLRFALQKVVAAGDIREARKLAEAGLASDLNYETRD